MATKPAVSAMSRGVRGAGGAFRRANSLVLSAPATPGVTLRFGFAAAAAAFCIAAGTGAQAATACLSKLAETPVTMNGLKPTVPVKVNGRPELFVLDTGDFFTMMSAATAEKDGVPTRDLPFGFNVSGFGGGQVNARLGRAATFSFAGVDLPNRDIVVGGRIGGMGAGLLGQELLVSFDVELDLANGVMRIWRPQNCGDANLAYWAVDGKPVSAIDIQATSLTHDHIVASAYVDGKLVHVMFDTGAGTSSISRQGAARAGVKINDAQVKPAGLSHGLGSGDVETYIAPFASFRLGDEEIKNALLRISDAPSRGDHDMLIGADFFLSHRVMISNSQHKLYFTYNGGPVFDLRPNAEDAPAPATAAASEPTTADGLARRAAAAATRRDYASAVADLERAVALAPKDVNLLYARSRAHFGAGQRDQAIADLDAALKLEPTNGLILIQRAESHLTMGQAQASRADLDAAANAGSGDPQTALRVAALYDRFGEIERAIGLYDAWVAANPKNTDATFVYASLCRARGIQGGDLARADADCAGALKEGDHTPAALIGRGLVRLRQGQLDAAITDEDDAIRLQPNSPWAFYARGLAKLKKGQRSAGEADVNSALSMQPALAQTAAHYGLPRPS
jgi:tetratricopeptide (TPR) repeat protein/predicted aspartyl protease